MDEILYITKTLDSNGELQPTTRKIDLGGKNKKVLEKRGGKHRKTQGELSSSCNLIGRGWRKDRKTQRKSIETKFSFKKGGKLTGCGVIGVPFSLSTGNGEKNRESSAGQMGLTRLNSLHEKEGRPVAGVKRNVISREDSFAPAGDKLQAGLLGTGGNLAPNEKGGRRSATSATTREVCPYG